jgi:hypothetical protein
MSEPGNRTHSLVKSSEPYEVDFVLLVVSCLEGSDLGDVALISFRFGEKLFFQASLS